MLRHRSDFVGTAQAARTLRLAKHTLDNMRCAGHGPAYYKLGGRVFYRVVDVRAWVNTCMRTNTVREGA